MVVIGANALWIGVVGEGRHKTRVVHCEQETSKRMPRGRDMPESNPFASIGSTQAIERCRIRGSEVIRTGVVVTEPSTNLTSKTTVSRLWFEVKNRMNVPKWNGFLYPMSLNSARDSMPNKAG